MLLEKPHKTKNRMGIAGIDLLPWLSDRFPDEAVAHCRPHLVVCTA